MSKRRLFLVLTLVLIIIEPSLCIWNNFPNSNEVSPPPISRRRSSTDATGQVISFGNNEISWDQTPGSVNVTPVNVTPKSFSEIFTGPQRVTLPSLVLVKQPKKDDEDSENDIEPFDIGTTKKPFSYPTATISTTTQMPIIVLSREKLFRDNYSEKKGEEERKKNDLMFVTPSRGPTTTPSTTTTTTARTRKTTTAKSVVAAISSTGVPASGNLPRSWTAANYDPRKFHKISSIGDNDDHYLISAVTITQSTTERPAFVTPLSFTSSTTTTGPSTTSKSIIDRLRQDYMKRRGGGSSARVAKPTTRKYERPRQSLLNGPTPRPKPKRVESYMKGPSIRFVDEEEAEDVSKEVSDAAEDRSYVPLKSNQYQVVHSPGVTTVYQETTRPTYIDDVNEFAASSHSSYHDAVDTRLASGYEENEHTSHQLSFDEKSKPLASTTAYYAPSTVAVSTTPPTLPSTTRSYLPPNAQSDFSTPPTSLTPPVGPPAATSYPSPSTTVRTTQTTIVTTTYDAIVPNNEVSSYYDDDGASYEDSGSSPASDIYQAGPVVIIMPNQAASLPMPPTQQDESTPKTNIKGMSGQVVPILPPTFSSPAAPKESSSEERNVGSAIEFPLEISTAANSQTDESLTFASNEDDAYLSPSSIEVQPQATMAYYNNDASNPFTQRGNKATTSSPPSSSTFDAPVTTGASSDLPRPSAAAPANTIYSVDNGLRTDGPTTATKSNDMKIDDEITKFISGGSGEVEVNFNGHKEAADVSGGVNQSINLKINVIVQNSGEEGEGSSSSSAEVELIDSLPRASTTPASTYFAYPQTSTLKTVVGVPFSRTSQEPILDNQPSLTFPTSPEANKHGRLVDSLQSDYTPSSTFRGQQKSAAATSPPATPDDYLYDSELNSPDYYVDYYYEYSPEIPDTIKEVEGYSVDLTDAELYQMYDDLYEVLGELETTLRTPTAAFTTATPPRTKANLAKKIPRPFSSAPLVAGQLNENSMSVVQPFSDEDFLLRAAPPRSKKKRRFKNTSGLYSAPPPDHKHLLREHIYPSNNVYPNTEMPAVMGVGGSVDLNGNINAGLPPARTRANDLKKKFMQYYYTSTKSNDDSTRPPVKSFYNFTADLIPDLRAVAKTKDWDVTDFSSWKRMFSRRQGQMDEGTFENGNPLKTVKAFRGNSRRKTLPTTSEEVTFDKLLEKKMRFSRLINYDVDRMDDSYHEDDDDVYELVDTLAKRQGEVLPEKYDDHGSSSAGGNYHRMPRDYTTSSKMPESLLPPTFDISFEDWLHKSRAADFPSRAARNLYDHSSEWGYRSRRKRLLEIDEPPSESPSSLRETLWQKLVESATNLQQHSKASLDKSLQRRSRTESRDGSESNSSKNKYFGSLQEVIGDFAHALLG